MTIAGWVTRALLTMSLVVLLRAMHEGCLLRSVIHAMSTHVPCMVVWPVCLQAIGIQRSGRHTKCGWFCSPDNGCHGHQQRKHQGIDQDKQGATMAWKRLTCAGKVWSSPAVGALVGPPAFQQDLLRRCGGSCCSGFSPADLEVQLLGAQRCADSCQSALLAVAEQPHLELPLTCSQGCYRASCPICYKKTHKSGSYASHLFPCQHAKSCMKYRFF